MAELFAHEATCKHCGDSIGRVMEGGVWHHTRGGNILYRCDPERSGKPYGLDATPEVDRG